MDPDVLVEFAAMEQRFALTFEKQINNPLVEDVICPIERILVGSARARSIAVTAACAACLPTVVVAETNGLIVFNVDTSQTREIKCEPSSAVRLVDASTVLLGSNDGEIRLARISGEQLDILTSYKCEDSVTLFSDLMKDSLVASLADGTLLLVTLGPKFAVRLFMAPTPQLGAAKSFAYQPRLGLLAVATETSGLVVIQISPLRVVYKSLALKQGDLFWTSSNKLVYGQTVLSADAFNQVSVVEESEWFPGDFSTLTLDCESPILWRHKDREVHVAEFGGNHSACHLLAASLPLNINLVGSKSFLFSLTLRRVDRNTVALDLHRLSLVDWRTLLNLLLDGEKWDQFFALATQLKEKLVPLLGFDLADLDAVVDRGTQRYPVGNADARLLVFLAKMSKLSQYNDLIVPLVLAGQISVLALDGTLVSACLDNIVDSTAMDTFIALLVLGWQPAAPPLDVDRAVRICILKNFVLSTVLLHVYLLGDYRFVFDFLRREGAATGETKELCYFLHACSHSLGYPVRKAGPLAPEPIIDLLMDQSELRKVKALLPDRFFLNSVPFSPKLFEYFWSVSPATQWEGKDDLIVYGLKCSSGSSLSAFSAKVDLSILQLIQLVADNKPVLANLIDSMDIVEGNVEIIEIIDHIEDEDLCLKFLNRVANFSLDKTVNHCLVKGHLALALSLLAERRDFTKFINILMDNAEIVAPKILKNITRKYAKFIPSEDLVVAWAALLNRVGLEGDFTENCDVIRLLGKVQKPECIAFLYQNVKQQTELQNKAKYLASVDVGKQFSILAKSNKRTAGIHITATICHVCMDPILSQGKVQLYSCKHIIHSKCCDVIDGKCPVCLHV